MAQNDIIGIPLTGIQSRVLDYIAAFQRLHGFPPTRQEIAYEMGYASANAAQCHIDAIRKKGYIEITPHISRGISITKRFRPGA